MEPFSSAQLLEVWERGRRASLVARAVELVRSACPELDAQRIAKLPIGARDRTLFEVRSLNFGSEVQALARCPACDERVEAAFDLSMLRELVEPAASSFQVSAGAVRVEFRLPCSLDLEAAISAGPERGRALLIERCIVDVEAEDSQLSESLLTAVAAEMGHVDPASDVQLAMACACGHAFSSSFDIVSYLWREIEVAARRLLEDVHALASAYGWAERDILALTPVRRRMYLEMVGR